MNDQGRRFILGLINGNSMLIIAYRLSEGSTSHLNIRIFPGCRIISMRLNDELLLAKANGDIERYNLFFALLLRNDGDVPCIMEAYNKRGRSLQRIQELHREGSIIIELEGT